MVIADPLLKFAEKLSVIDRSPATAVSMIGANGNPAGVTDWAGDDATLSPAAFTAFTIIAYVLPFSNSVITNELAVDAGLRSVQISPLSIEYL